MTSGPPTATAGSAFLPPHSSFFFCSAFRGKRPSAPGAPIICRTARRAHAACHGRLCHRMHKTKRMRAPATARPIGHVLPTWFIPLSDSCHTHQRVQPHIPGSTDRAACSCGRGGTDVGGRAARRVRKAARALGLGRLGRRAAPPQALLWRAGARSRRAPLAARRRVRPRTRRPLAPAPRIGALAPARGDRPQEACASAGHNSTCTGWHAAQRREQVRRAGPANASACDGPVSTAAAYFWQPTCAASQWCPLALLQAIAA